jgi:hypothetical protein
MNPVWSDEWNQLHRLPQGFQIGVVMVVVSDLGSVACEPLAEFLGDSSVGYRGI